MSVSSAISQQQTGPVAPFAGLVIPRTESAYRTQPVGDVIHIIRDIAPVAVRLRRQELQRKWMDAQRAAAMADGSTLLGKLSDAGMAWRDVARLVGVSVAAVQKWRRGEGITGANRLKLAGIVAVLQCLHEEMINEPVSWLEMPVHAGVALTSVDLMAAGRYDLVLELADGEHSPAETTIAVLDEFDPHWRDTRVDETFEVFVADDGIPSIRPRAVP